MAGLGSEDGPVAREVEVDKENCLIPDVEVEGSAGQRRHSDEPYDPSNRSARRLHLVEVDAQPRPGQLDLPLALGDEVEDQGDNPEVEQERHRQVEQGFEGAHRRHINDGKHEEALLEDDGRDGEDKVEGEEERRIAKEVPLEGRGDDRAAVQVFFGHTAGRAVGGDDLGERRFRGFAEFLFGFFEDMASDLGEDFLPFLAAGKEMADFFEIGFQFFKHGVSPP